MRALISAYDKTGLVPFARGLADLGFELVASGGTATALEEAGLHTTRVEDVTGFPELLDGRVKTLHPRIHAGILARRDHPEDLAALEEQGIEPFDLVCVNLYPFERAASGHRLEDEEVIELIDVGGPSMLRAAAKNHAHVTPVCRPEDYEEVLAELREHGGTTSPETRRRLASIAFTVAAAYDSAISRWFQGDEELPEVFVPTFDKTLELAYGENPQQGAAYYAERGRRTHVLSRVEQLSGKPLSFNNVNDLSAGRLLIRELDQPGCVIIKHANPCGVAVAERIEDAYARALAADPVSAYGGVVVLNRAVTAGLGEALAEKFVEVLFAPGYDEQAMEALARRGSVRILDDTRAPRARRDRAGLSPCPRRPARAGPGLVVSGARRHGGRLRGARERPVARPALRVAGREARHVERDRHREAGPDARDRRGPAESRRRRAPGGREGASARPRPRGSGARLGCVLPVRGRGRGRARSGDLGDHPARRLEAGRGGRGGGLEGGPGDGPHQPPALPALSAATRYGARTSASPNRPRPSPSPSP